MKDVPTSLLKALIAAVGLFLFGMAYTFEGVREVISLRYGFVPVSGFLFIYVVLSLSAAASFLKTENEQIKRELDQIKSRLDS